MKNLKKTNLGISTVLAFCLIPITGLALDIYLPSLPDMSLKMSTTPPAIQLSISVFLITYGIGQLIVGGLLDYYGRFWPNIIALAGFSLASLMIAATGSLSMIYAMRAVQGIMCSAIIVSKRGFFFDLFSGEQLKRPVYFPWFGRWLLSLRLLQAATCKSTLAGHQIFISWPASGLFFFCWS